MAMNASQRVDGIIEKHFSSLFLRDSELESIKKFLIFQIQNEELQVSSKRNLKIICDNLKKAENVGSQIIQSLHELLLESQVTIKGYRIKESEIANDIISIEANRQKQILLIYGCSRIAPQDWNTIREFYVRSREIVKIMVFDRATEQERFRNDDHIYYRIFNDTLYLCDYSADDALKACFDKLRKKKFELSNVFVADMTDYVNTVYPKADLVQEEFVQDLVDRVLNLFFEEDIESSPSSEKGNALYELSGKHIPYYRKHPSKSKEIKYESAENSGYKDESISQSKTGMLLLFLSDYKNNPKKPDEEAPECTYLINGKEYRGRQTNEAPCKYLMDKASEDGYPINTVICIASNAVRTSHVCGRGDRKADIKNPDGDTSYMIFENRIKKLSENEEVKVIPLGYNEDRQQENALKIYAGLTDLTSQVKHKKIYIDYTGGMRDTSFLMTSIIQYLEYIGIECGAVAYSDYDKKEIRDISYIYSMMRMINAVNEFVSSGNAKGLIGFKEYAGLDNLDILLSKLRSFSESISLYNISRIVDCSAEIKTELEKIKNLNSKPASGELWNALYYQMFETIVPLFEEKLYMKRITDNPELAYKNIPWIIKWCLDNDLVQQAATLYVERMPAYYCKMFFTDLEGNEKLNSEDFYGLFEDFCPKEKNPEESLAEWAKNFTNRDDAKNLYDELKQINTSLVSIHPNVDFEDVLERILNIYDCNGNRIESHLLPYGNSNITVAKNITGMINSIAKGERRLLHYLIYNDSDSYTDIEKKNRTYQKKYDSIKRIEEGSIAINRNLVPESLNPLKLAQIMRGYLAIKIIRNNLSHANDNIAVNDSKDTIDESENDVKNALESDGYVMRNSVDSIKSNILKAIKDELL